MNCQEFKNQFEDGLDLNESAKIHLESCESCESLISENLQLSQMLSSLPRVEAPKDFAFDVKSKIAQSKPSKKLSPIWQTLRYVVPFATAVLIFGIVLVNSNLFTDKKASPIAEIQEPTKQVEKNDKSSFETKEISDESLVADVKDSVNQKQENPIQKTIEKKIDKPQTEIADNKSKSLEKKDSEKDKILTKDIKPEKNKSLSLASEQPKVFTKKDPNNEALRRKVNEGSTPFMAQDILSTLGIETINENGVFRVKSLNPNSVAQKSGLKVGDIITAIDNQALSNKPIKTSTIRGRVLRIKRDNKKMIIVIRNR